MRPTLKDKQIGWVLSVADRRVLTKAKELLRTMAIAPCDEQTAATEAAEQIGCVLEMSQEG